LKKNSKITLAELYASPLYESMEIITTNYQFFQYELTLDEFKNSEPPFFQEIEEIKKQKKVEISEESIHKFNKSINEEIVRKRKKFNIFKRKKMKKETLFILGNIGLQLNLLFHLQQITTNK
jgi:hypothetical protein